MFKTCIQQLTKNLFWHLLLMGIFQFLWIQKMMCGEKILMEEFLKFCANECADTLLASDVLKKKSQTFIRRIHCFFENWRWVMTLQQNEQRTYKSLHQNLLIKHTFNSRLTSIPSPKISSNIINISSNTPIHSTHNFLLKITIKTMLHDDKFKKKLKVTFAFCSSHNDTIIMSLHFTHSLQIKVSDKPFWKVIYNNWNTKNGEPKKELFGLKSL